MIRFICKTFQELSNEELYASMVLRQEVFVLEQNCPYLDADGKDQDAWHLLGFDTKGSLIAYLRILPKGISYENYPSIGRVVTSQSIRRNGAGKALMLRALEETDRLFPGEALKISAQVYLLRFYSDLGFQAVGEEYLEDGIPHIAMIRK